MDRPLLRLLALAPRPRLATLAALTLVVAASEGAGFVLLVPLLERLAAGPPAAALPFALPQLPLPALLGLFVALVALRSGAEIARSLSAQDLRAATVDALRSRALSALVGAEWRALAAMDQSATRALLLSDIARVEHAAELLATLLRLALALAALGLAALAIAPGAAAGLALAAMLALVVLAPARRRARALGAGLTARHAALHAELEQTLGGLRLIKSFGREDAARRSGAAAFAALRWAERAYVRQRSATQAAVQVAGAALLAGAVALAHGGGGVALATLLPLVALVLRAVPLLVQLQGALQDWHHAIPALAEAEQLIFAAETAAEARPAPAPVLRSAIALHSVAVDRGRGRPGLAPVDCTIPAGTSLAVEGPSGSGKSTLADVLGGLLAPDRGTVSIDGTPLDAAHRSGWRRRVAYVQQEPLLFSGTVRSNLLWAAPGASPAEIERALDRAAAGFVHALPGGLDADIGALGSALSGGERQRLALARALLREPDLLILDEAASALDPANEAIITAAARALEGLCTVVVIGHRGALAASATQRLVLPAPELNG